ncbi:hypothetical protein D3C86_1423020 [compost metagenome]
MRNDLWVVHNPERMADLIFRSKLIYRLMIGFPVFQRMVHIGYIFTGQEYQPGMRTGYFNMISAVQNTVRLGKFMFLDAVMRIVFQGRAAYQSCLATAVHHQLVYIITLLVVLYQDALFNKTLQVVFGLQVYFRTVSMCCLRQIDF